MTAVQKIIEQIDEEVQVLSNLYGSEIKGRLIALAFAKKRCLEVLEMEKQQIIDAYNNGDLRSADLYYDETYGSKDIEKSGKPINLTSSQTEISDEEIEKEADNTYVKYNAYAIEGFIDGAKWYREQLKQKK